MTQYWNNNNNNNSGYTEGVTAYSVRRRNLAKKTDKHRHGIVESHPACAKWCQCVLAESLVSPGVCGQAGSRSVHPHLLFPQGPGEGTLLLHLVRGAGAVAQPVGVQHVVRRGRGSHTPTGGAVTGCGGSHGGLVLRLLVVGGVVGERA